MSLLTDTDADGVYSEGECRSRRRRTDKMSFALSSQTALSPSNSDIHTF